MIAPNVLGEYPRVPVPAGELIAASVPFPAAAPGDRIAVQAEDGGRLIGDAASGIVRTSGGGRAAIEFQAPAFEGAHRITLRRGGESRTLEFWVGPDPPVLVRE